MNFVSLLRAILGLASTLANYLQSKQLMDAGEAQAVIKSLEHAQNAITKANKARDISEHDFDARDGVPDDSDPNLRD